MWILIGYPIISILVSRFVFAAMCRDDYFKPDGKGDMIMVGLLAFIAGLFWPLIIPVRLIIWHPRKTPDQILAERDAKIAEQAAYIRKLEIENGIGQYGR